MPRGRRKAGGLTPAFPIEDSMSETTVAEPELELDIRSLILDLHQKIDHQNDQLEAQRTEIGELREKVKQNAGGLPKFQPSGGRHDYDTIFAGLQKGKPFAKDGDHARLVIGTDGHPLSDAELRRSPPLFDVGDFVGLNLDATREGSPKSWGEIVNDVTEKQRMRRRKLPSTVGRVKHIQYRRDEGSYKYRVVFPNLTGLNPDKDRGDGFDEYELQPLSEAV